MEDGDPGIMIEENCQGLLKWNVRTRKNSISVRVQVLPTYIDLVCSWLVWLVRTAWILYFSTEARHNSEYLCIMSNQDRLSERSSEVGPVLVECRIWEWLVSTWDYHLHIMTPILFLFCARPIFITVLDSSTFDSCPQIYDSWTCLRDMMCCVL